MSRELALGWIVHTFRKVSSPQVAISGFVGWHASPLICLECAPRSARVAPVAASMNLTAPLTYARTKTPRDARVSAQAEVAGTSVAAACCKSLTCCQSLSLLALTKTAWPVDRARQIVLETLSKVIARMAVYVFTLNWTALWNVTPLGSISIQ